MKLTRGDAIRLYALGVKVDDPVEEGASELTTEAIIRRADEVYHRHQNRVRGRLSPACEMPDGSRWVPQSVWEQTQNHAERLAVQCSHLAAERDAARKERDRLIAKITEMSDGRPWWRRMADAFASIALQIEPVYVGVGAGAVGAALLVAAVAGIVLWRVTQ